MYRKILVALDPFAEYKAIVDCAVTMAGSVGELTLIHVHEPRFYIDMKYADSQPEQEVVHRATAILAEIGSDIDVPVGRQLIEYGKPAKVIREKVLELGIDLIVVGTHGQRGVELMLGSTANAIVHNAPCNIHAVRVSE